MSRHVVGLIGHKGSGKDAFASRLVERGYTRLAFADPLKALLYDINPRYAYIVDQVGREEAKAYPEVREALQRLGVACRDHLGDGVWVEPLARQLQRTPGNIAIPGVRFPNEVDFVRSQGGILIRIVRPDLKPDATSNHISETALDDVKADYRVVNDGTLEDLLATADDCADRYDMAL